MVKMVYFMLGIFYYKNKSFKRQKVSKYINKITQNTEITISSIYSSTRKAMANLDSVLKSRDITLPTKVQIVKAMVFPVVTRGCESWTVKKAEHQRTDAFMVLEKKSLLGQQGD